MGEYVNSNQARFDKSFISCGVLEVHHLPKQSASKTVFSIANALFHKANPRPAAYIIFSDVVDKNNNSRGEQVAEHIEKIKGHGVLIKTNPKINPKTGNLIKVWLWEINHEAMREWYKEELANLVSEQD